MRLPSSSSIPPTAPAIKPARDSCAALIRPTSCERSSDQHA